MLIKFKSALPKVNLFITFKNHLTSIVKSLPLITVGRELKLQSRELAYKTENSGT
jgi:hypothetical protein